MINKTNIELSNLDNFFKDENNNDLMIIKKLLNFIKNI